MDTQGLDSLFLVSLAFASSSCKVADVEFSRRGYDEKCKCRILPDTLKHSIMYVI